MLTSYLRLSGNGLNSLPLAVTFPTLPSARCSGLCSVPDELLKILTPAGGQGGCSPWLRGGVAPSLCPHHAHLARHPPPRGLPCLLWHPSPKHLIHRKSPRGLRLRRGATPSASDLNPQPIMTITCSVTLGKHLPSLSLDNEWVGPNGLPNLCKCQPSLIRRSE